MRFVTAFFIPQRLKIAAPTTALADLKGFQNLSGLYNQPGQLVLQDFGFAEAFFLAFAQSKQLITAETMKFGRIPNVD